MKRFPASLVIVLMLALVGAGCSSGAGGSTGSVRGEAAEALPDATLRDWVTYSDHLVVWTATAESRGEPDPDDTRRGEGFIARHVAVKTDDVVWTRPGLRATLQKGPAELDVVSGGWVFHDGAEDKPLLMDDDVRLEVGHQYLAVLSYADISLFGSTTPRPDADGPTWVAVDWVKFDNGVIDPKAALDNAAEFPARAAVAGKTTAVAAKLLSGTSIDPKAKPYMDLDPMLRYQKVQDLEFATMEPKPGPGPGEKE